MNEAVEAMKKSVEAMKKSIFPESLVTLGLEQPIWERFFTVAPLVVVGTREPDGSYDLAPKHLAMPIGWSNRFGFICTPRHRTYHNAKRAGSFTVTYPRPSQVVLSSLAALPRCEDQTKPIMDLLPAFPARVVDGPFVKDGSLFLGCTLERIVDDLGDSSLIIGQVVEAYRRIHSAADGKSVSETVWYLDLLRPSAAPRVGLRRVLFGRSAPDALRLWLRFTYVSRAAPSCLGP